MDDLADLRTDPLVGVDRDALTARSSGMRAPWTSATPSRTWASTSVIAGDPMNDATKVLTGRS